MARYYFSSDNEESCHTLDYFRESILSGDELTVYPAKMIVGGGFFYCRYVEDVGEVGEGCGKVCDWYSPRNGKNGRCRHSANCYEPDYSKPKILTLN